MITMRPSDVPTYVEAGAADIGITGKDVLAEQSERAVYELLDLGFGPLHDGVRDGRGRRPGGRGAAPPRRDARRHQVPADRRALSSSETGRQAEIVEVKGSVELAPLTGLVEAIVDLTATGTTLRENGLVVREEIVVSHGAPDRQPGRAQAARRRRSTSCWAACARSSMLVERMRLQRPVGRAGAPRRLRALVPARRVGVGRRGARSSRPCERGTRRATRASLDVERRFGGGELPVRVRRGGAARRRSTALDLAVRAGCRSRSPTSRAWPRRGWREDAAVELAAGPARSTLREVPGRAARRSTCPAAARPYPSTVVMGVVTARAAGVRRRRRVRAAADGEIDPVILAACRAVRRRARLPDGRRAGDRRARLRHRDRPAAST